MTKTENQNCPACDAPSVQVIQRTSTRTSKGGVTVSFPDELMQCAACGERFYTYEQSMANSRAFTAALSDAQGLMSPPAIHAARVNLGFSQTELETAFGFGKKTAVRWEKGTIAPSRAANFALWVAAYYPEIVHEYASRPMPQAQSAEAASVPVFSVVSEATLVAHISPKGSTRFRRLRETEKRATRKASFSSHRRRMSTQPAPQERGQA